MEMSKLKQIQRYTTSFELDFGKFEHQPQSDQLSIIFTPSIELIFKTLETAEIDLNPHHSMIDPIFNRKFENTCHHQNGPNQHQHTKKMPAISTITEKLVNNISIDVPVNNINPDPSKEI